VSPGQRALACASLANCPAAAGAVAVAGALVAVGGLEGCVDGAAVEEGGVGGVAIDGLAGAAAGGVEGCLAGAGVEGGVVGAVAVDGLAGAGAGGEIGGGGAEVVVAEVPAGCVRHSAMNCFLVFLLA
jgi:hypothetical protein